MGVLTVPQPPPRCSISTEWSSVCFGRSGVTPRGGPGTRPVEGTLRSKLHVLSGHCVRTCMWTQSASEVRAPSAVEKMMSAISISQWGEP